MAARFDEVTGQSRQYIALTGLAGLIQAAVNLGILLAAGVDAPVTWAVLFFFLNFIPGVGFLRARSARAARAARDGWQRALIVIVGWWFVNIIGDNVIKPRFFVKGLDSHSPHGVLDGVLELGAGAGGGDTRVADRAVFETRRGVDTGPDERVAVPRYISISNAVPCGRNTCARRRSAN